jgi:hypothetical protein
MSRKLTSHEAARTFHVGDIVRHRYRGKMEAVVRDIGARDLQVQIDGANFLATWFAELCYLVGPTKS